MNISAVDYNMRQKVTPEGDAMNFRYELTCKTKVNVFIPKAAAEGSGSDPMKVLGWPVREASLFQARQGLVGSRSVLVLKRNLDIEFFFVQVLSCLEGNV